MSWFSIKAKKAQVNVGKSQTDRLAARAERIKQSLISGKSKMSRSKRALLKDEFEVIMKELGARDTAIYTLLNTL